MNALADPKVGKYINEHFVAAFQKVGTFRIVGRQKQGGNVATYFCAQDGRVLHAIAGPVNAQTMLKESKWVVEKVKQSLAAAEQGKSFKAEFRQAHAERLRREHGLTVEPVKFDAPVPGADSALSYRDPTGKMLAPKLPPPPIEGPDVSFNEDQSRIRKDHGAENFGWLRRFAVSLLKNEPTIKDTIRAKRMRATYNVNYLEKVLLAATDLA